MMKSKQSRYRNSLDKQVSLPEMKELLIEHAGNVTSVSKKIGCTRQAVYNYFEKFPELKEVQKKADEWHGDAELDTSYYVLDKLLEDVEENPNTAFQSAKLIVSKSKKSRYYDKEKEAELSASFAAVAALAQKSEDQEKLIQSLKAQLDD